MKQRFILRSSLCSVLLSAINDNMYVFSYGEFFLKNWLQDRFKSKKSNFLVSYKITEHHLCICDSVKYDKIMDFKSKSINHSLIQVTGKIDHFNKENVLCACCLGSN